MSNDISNPSEPYPRHERNLTGTFLGQFNGRNVYLTEPTESPRLSCSLRPSEMLAVVSGLTLLTGVLTGYTARRLYESHLPAEQLAARTLEQVAAGFIAFGVVGIFVSHTFPEMLDDGFECS